PRDPDALVFDRPRVVGAHTERLPRARFDSFRLAVDDKEDDIGLVLAAGRAGLGHIEIGLAGARRERLFGVEHIVVAVTRRFGKIVPPMSAGPTLTGGIGPEQSAAI